MQRAERTLEVIEIHHHHLGRFFAPRVGRPVKLDLTHRFRVRIFIQIQLV